MFLCFKNVAKETELFWLKQAKTEHIIRINNVIHLVNDDKIHVCTKQGSFINILHSYNACGAEFNHDS